MAIWCKGCITKERGMRGNTLDITRIPPQLPRSTAPSAVTILATSIYTIADTLFILRLMDTDASSTINIVCPIISLIISLSSMLISGGVAMLCRGVGAGLLEKVRKNAALPCTYTIDLGCTLAIDSLLFTDELLRLLHARDGILPYTRGYLSTLLLFTPFCIPQVLCQSVFVATGHPLLGMLLAMCAGGINVILDLTFISGFHMGTEGGALAAGTGYMVSVIYRMFFFL